jgi:N utilization substance protein B
MSSRSRHQARVAVMQAIFAYEFNGGDVDKILQESLLEKDEGAIQEQEYAKKTLAGILKNRADITTKIKEFAIEWPLEKIAPTDRAIMEVGVYEIVYSDDVPPIVAINEAIEMAKAFGDLNAPKFVNGVLSAVLKKYCTHRDHKTGKPTS